MAMITRFRYVTASIVALCGLSPVYARLGEDPIQFANRYGAPKDGQVSQINDRNSPLIEGAIHHTYEYQGWKIRAAFLQENGPAVRVEYSKILNGGVNPRVQDYELQAIMNANAPAGYVWKEIAYNNPNSPNKSLEKFSQALGGALMGEKMWQRSDGAILWLRSHLIVRLELPAAREYEAKLKTDKEQKTRASVPPF
jgi:hypothetical protein